MQVLRENSSGDVMMPYYVCLVWRSFIRELGSVNAVLAPFATANKPIPISSRLYPIRGCGWKGPIRGNS